MDHEFHSKVLKSLVAKRLEVYIFWRFFVVLQSLSSCGRVVMNQTKGISMSKNITLTESQYLRLLKLISALEEQSVLFSWTSLEYGTTLKIIATG